MDSVGVCLITDVFTHSSPQSSCFTLTGSDLVATGSCSYSNCGNLGWIEAFLSRFAFDAFLQTFLTLGGTFSFSGLFRLPYNIHTRYLDHECLVDNNVCGIKKNLQELPLHAHLQTLLEPAGRARLGGLRDLAVPGSCPEYHVCRYCVDK